MPVDLGAALRHDAGLGATELGGGCAGILEAPAIHQAQVVARILQSRYVDGKVRHTVQQAEKDGRHAVLAGFQCLGPQPAEPHARIVPDQDVELPQRQKPAARVSGLFVQPPLVAALHVAVVEGITSKHV